MTKTDKTSSYQYFLHPFIVTIVIFDVMSSFFAIFIDTTLKITILTKFRNQFVPHQITHAVFGFESIQETNVKKDQPYLFGENPVLDLQVKEK